MDLSTKDVQRLVQAGGKYFDKVNPKWFARLDVTEIDVNAARFSPAIAALGKDWDTEVTVKDALMFGLSFPATSLQIQELATKFWRYETGKRQRAALVKKS